MRKGEAGPIRKALGPQRLPFPLSPFLPLILVISFVLSCLATPCAEASITVFFTSDTRGWIEPCRCREGQLGGLAQRATLLKKLRAASPKALLLENGNLVDSSSEYLKMGAILRCFAAMGYDAVNLASLDARFPATVGKGLKDGKLIGLASEPSRFTRWSRTAPIHSYTIRAAGGVRVALVGASRFNGDRRSQALRRTLDAIASARRRSDLVIVLSQLSAEENRRLIASSRKVDLMITAGAEKGPLPVARIGKTPVVATDLKGGRIGRVVLTRKGKEWGVSATYHKVDESLESDVPVDRIVHDYYREVSKLLLAGASDKLESDYITADRCGFCHTDYYAHWKQTPHANAMRVLEKRGKSHVPECLRCHSGYYRATSQASTNGAAKAGVECVACHGGDTLHVIKPNNGGVTKKPGEPICKQCHIPEKSPNFNYAAYSKKVKHRLRTSYHGPAAASTLCAKCKR